MAMKGLFLLQIPKKDSKSENFGLAIWQLLLIIIFSSMISYLILFIQQNQLPPIECKEEDKNKDGWVKCDPENINSFKK